MYANAGPDAPEHVVFLPYDWTPSGKAMPLLIEYPGNRFQEEGLDGGTHNMSGLAADCRMGYGLSGSPDSRESGIGCIWASLPFIQYDPADPEDISHHREAPEWFGAPEDWPFEKQVNDPLGQGLAAAYLRAAVFELCEKYHADPTRVVFVGFSRGAIAGGCVGRYNDATAALFRAFILHAHHDSVISPVAPHDPNLTRLRRVGARPSFLSWGSRDSGREDSLQAATLLRSVNAPVYTHEIPDLPHTDEWILDMYQDRPACRAARDAARRFLQQVLATPDNS